MNCPKCEHENCIKNGKIKGTQRYKCKSCGFQFTRMTPRGRPLWQKALAVFLYSHGLSMNAIAKMLEVHPSSILKWIRNFAKQNCEKPKPIEGKTVVLEVDEMWHYVKKRKSYGSGKLSIVIPENLSTGNVVIGIKKH